MNNYVFRITIFVLLSTLVGVVSAQTTDFWRLSERNTIENDFEFINENEVNFFTDYVRETVHYSDSYPELVDSLIVQTRHSQDAWLHSYTAHFNPVVTYQAQNKTITYNTDGPGYLHNRRIEVYDNQNRLIQLANLNIHPPDDITYAVRKTIFYMPDNSIDSMFKSVYEIGSQTSYSKYIPEYDQQGKRIAEIQYSCYDSLNWEPTNRKLYTYTNAVYPAGFSFRLDNPLYDLTQTPWQNLIRSFDQGLVTPFVVDSVIVQYYSDSAWHDSQYCRYYAIITANNRIDINATVIDPSMIPFPPDYIPPLGCFSFDLNGNFLGQYRSVDDGLAPPWSETINYSWDYYVSNEDNIVTPNQSSISTYPNPFKSTLKIKFTGKDKAPADISIYNIKGQLIRSWKDNKATEFSWDGKDMSNQAVSSGVYLIKAKQGRAAICRKVMKL